MAKKIKKASKIGYASKTKTIGKLGYPPTVGKHPIREKKPKTTKTPKTKIDIVVDEYLIRNIEIDREQIASFTVKKLIEICEFLEITHPKLKSEIIDSINLYFDNHS